ncbi:MAG: DinB family protein [Dehalococcoidia bacterium]|nr:DinB family protein [Dehalococcoidia bacterium]
MTTPSGNSGGTDRTGVELLLWLLDEAFEGSEHSLLTNVASLPEEHWACVPEGAGRTVGAILGHVGGAKYMYENFAFEDGTYEAGKPPVAPPLGRGPLIEWLRECQRRFVTSLGTLSDRRLVGANTSCRGAASSRFARSRT